MYVKRDFEDYFSRIIRSGKVLVVYGSRQSGKTTLVNHLLDTAALKSNGVVRLNGDVKAHRDVMSYETMSAPRARLIAGDAKLLFIDEAQKIMNVGLSMKIVHDALPDLQIVATGSSSFELSEEVGEPLTGRMASFVLPPLSFHELASANGAADEIAQLETRIRLGSYPDVVTAPSEFDAIENLHQLCENYLFKDVLKWNSLKNSEMLNKLLKALALQLGNEVSYKEVGNLIGVDNETVQSYVERLEKAFVLFRLPPFSRNLRKELKKSRKVYFCDTGIRNAILDNFLRLDNRDDVGHLFENYLIAERWKHNNVARKRVRSHFWRTSLPSDGEVDYLEESPEIGLRAYEFKFSPAKAQKAKCPPKFASAYPEAVWNVVSRENYADFVNGLI